MKTTQTYKIGDCLELMKEIPDKSIDLILTDPPYGIGESRYERGGSQRGHSKAICANYGVYDWDDERVKKEVFDEIFRVSKNQIIFGGNYYIDYLYPTPCWIVWYKDNGNNGYADCELAWGSFNSAVRFFKWKWHGMLQEDMSHKEERLHPTQKPIELFKWIIKKYTKEYDVVLDPFLGSGTTLRACRETNRNGIGFEINPDYESIIRERVMADIPPLESFAEA